MDTLPFTMLLTAAEIAGTAMEGGLGTVTETAAGTTRSPAGLILPLIFLAVTVALGILAVRLLARTGQKQGTPGATTRTQAAMTAQEFINVLDISGPYLFTPDGLAICYVRIHGISTDLYSDTEKRSLMRQLTADISGTAFPFKFTALSRPVDISPVLAAMQETLMAAGDQKQKELLRREIQHMGQVALNAEVVERQFYLSVWGAAADREDTLKNAAAMAERFGRNGVRAEVLGEKEIIGLVNLAHNPSYIHIEDTDYSAVIPFIREPEEKKEEA